MQILNNSIYALNVSESLKFEEHEKRFLTGSGNATISRIRNGKNMQYNPYLWQNCQNFRILQEIGSRNTTVTSDFTPKWTVI